MDMEVVCSYAKFSDAEAFTKDGILVFNIRAKRVPKGTNIHYIKQYFEKFGKVMNVYRRETGYRPNRMSPFFVYEIQYAEAKSAARALMASAGHRIKNQIIHVEACHSLQQPDGQNYLAQANKNISGIQNNWAPILNLNDDCLELICKYFSPSDQINFALSCRRFRSVLALLSKVQYKNFDTDILAGMTLSQQHLFLQIVGPQIKTLTIRELSTTGPMAPLINVEKLIVIGLNSNPLCELIEQMHLLQEMDLFQVGFGDEFIAALYTLKHLQKLKIHGNAQITGALIAKLERLQLLALQCCPQVLPKFIGICEKLVNLKYLDVGCKNFKLDTEHYENIVKNLTQLETLKIVCYRGNFNCLAYLPKLVHLEIVVIETNGLLEHLVEQLENQLENLFLIVLNGFTVEDVASVGKLKNLKVLRCNLNLCGRIANEITALREIKKIEVLRSTGDAVLKLLKKCLQLKMLSCCYAFEGRDLIHKSLKFVEQQRKQGERTGNVTLIDNKREYEDKYNIYHILFNDNINYSV